MGDRLTTKVHHFLGRFGYHDFQEWTHFKVQFTDGSFAFTARLDGKRTRFEARAYVWKAQTRRSKPLDVLEAWAFADRRKAPFRLVRTHQGG